MRKAQQPVKQIKNTGSNSQTVEHLLTSPIPKAKHSEMTNNEPV
ncbi:hypothetical protein [Paenibacillus turpanensis]|nr:hypothetical protein [Paenibacillus turpanensis]